VRSSSVSAARTPPLLERLVHRRLLAKVRDKKAPGAPNVYRVTAEALRAAGFPTVEAMRGAVAQGVTAEQQMRLLDAMPATGDDRELMVDTGS
jgi:chromosome segregation and condensation protein ScpB